MKVGTPNNTPMKSKHNDSAVIDRLGGTFAVARLCEVRPPSVSEWRNVGIPRARKQFLRLAYPAAFDLRDDEAEVVENATHA